MTQNGFWSQALMRIALPGILLGLLSVPAISTETLISAAPAPFLRDATIRVLGYDPEVSAPHLCQKQSNIAGLMRVALAKEQPLETMLPMRMKVAGHLGAARAVCDDDAQIGPLPPFKPVGEWTRDLCNRASKAIIMEPLRELVDMAVHEHPDLAAGYADGVAAEVEQVNSTCSRHFTFLNPLEDRAKSYAIRAQDIRKDRACTLWRGAFSKEISDAIPRAEREGKKVGLKMLELRGLSALLAVRHHCVSDEFYFNNAAWSYDIARTTLELLPDE
jgi:hypothetical protein